MTNEEKQLSIFMPDIIHDVEIEILERCQYGPKGSIRRLYMTDEAYQSIDQPIRIVKHMIINQK